ncbi:MAG: hypothetical protein E7266_08910 [Lachnospiraceae bacterium]|nr:hypothetical protein [Lachnospiraceae bacterium]
MKKGIMNIIIIILLVTNIALSAVIVFAVVPAMNSANTLVKKVAEAIDLQKEASKDSGSVSIEDMENYTIENKITANLKNGSDGKTHYVVVKVVLVLDKSDEGYGKYYSKGKLAENEEFIKGKVIDILSSYSNDNITENKTAILNQIRDELQEFFNQTKFINSVSFSEFIIS